MESQALEFVARRCAVPAGALRLHVRPLGGGLESAVVRATLRGAAETPGGLPRRFVIKELRGRQRREATVYQELWHAAAASPAARVLAIDCTGDAHYLYLEDVRPLSAWPWAEADLAAVVCRTLATVHATLPPKTDILLDWDYESELAHSARDTLALALVAMDRSGRRHWRRLGDLRRVVAALPVLRARLMQSGATVIHGDVHPGNVIVRRGRGPNRIVLIDWARARIGSPLEDVASWLHSLGCWESEARKRHDTLLRHYREARGATRELTAEFRTAYWFASASNGLAGAIRYHLAVLGDPAAGELLRRSAQQALPAWERVIRRAASLLPPVRLAEAEHRLR
jgi:aminoglycoside phosphotransferase (APT) family kinase protein